MKAFFGFLLGLLVDFLKGAGAAEERRRQAEAAARTEAKAREAQADVDRMSDRQVDDELARWVPKDGGKP